MSLTIAVLRLNETTLLLAERDRYGTLMARKRPENLVVTFHERHVILRLGAHRGRGFLGLRASTPQGPIGPVVTASRKGRTQGGKILEKLARDLRFSIRTLIKAPVFTALGLVTLALGIGANTAIFSVVDNVLLRPLPYRDSARLVALYGAGSDPSSRNPVSPDDFVKWQERNHVFESMAAISNVGWNANLTGAGDPVRLEGLQVSADFFNVLGVQPLLGRAFLPDEDKPGHSNVVVLSHALWQRRFTADTEIVGNTLRSRARDSSSSSSV